jgi:type I restriction-modification system DNA methylase subunit
MFKITPKQKNIQVYYKELKEFERLGQAHEGTVKIAFQHLLETIAKQSQWVLTQETTLNRGKKRIRLDGVLFDNTNIPRGYWEAKDSKDDLSKEVQKKLYQDNYPDDNIIFQAPNRERWDLAAQEFKSWVPELSKKLLGLIRQARVDDKDFKAAFNSFAEQCHHAINPNLTDAAIAATIDEYDYKQHFLNTVYERFFQGFSVKVADTHGIVYTPQPIVDFMVKSVDDILQKEFGKSLASKGVHFLDPFVGTGNFLVGSKSFSFKR